MDRPLVAPAPVVTEHAGGFRNLFDHHCQLRHVQHDLTGRLGPPGAGPETASPTGGRRRVGRRPSAPPGLARVGQPAAGSCLPGAPALPPWGAIAASVAGAPAPRGITQGPKVIGGRAPSHHPPLPRRDKEVGIAARLGPVKQFPNQVRDYPLEVIIPAGSADTGATLSDQVKSLDWQARNASLICTLSPTIMTEGHHKPNTLGALAPPDRGHSTRAWIRCGSPRGSCLAVWARHGTARAR
jgi:mRNA interferase MazF